MRTSQIPLSALVHTQRDLAPLAVTHTQSFPSTTVSFNVLDDVPLEIATSNIQRAVDELHMPQAFAAALTAMPGTSTRPQAISRS
jgi:multidrug efflux pump